MRVCMLIFVSFFVVPIGWGVAQEDEDTIGEHQVEEFGLTLRYRGDAKPSFFLRTTPLVAGDWSFTGETETHYLGSLSYPTENTAEYGPGTAGVPFVVSNLKIRKSDDMPIDLTERYPGLVLRDPDPDTPLSMRGDDTVYELVGYAMDPLDTSVKYSMLFQRNSKLRYRVPKSDE